MFRITTVAKEYGEDEGLGILVYFKDACLDVSIREQSHWYVGHETPNEFGSGFMVKLGKFCMEYTGGIYNER